MSTPKLPLDLERLSADFALSRTVSLTRDEFRALITEARISRELEEALGWIMPKVHQGNHDGELAECGKATCIEYRSALSRIAALRGGG